MIQTGQDKANFRPVRERQLEQGLGGAEETGRWQGRDRYLARDATYVTSQNSVDDGLLRRYHPPCDKAKMAELLPPVVTEQEVTDVKSLKNGKACGGDAIPNEALKHTISGSAHKLAHLYTR